MVDYPESLYEALRMSSPQYQKELQERAKAHDEKRQQWERVKSISKKEWLTEWGAGLLLAEGLGMEELEVRNAADREGRINSEIRKAINCGELLAISELHLNAIRPSELGKYTRVLIKKEDFTEWLIKAYPTVEWMNTKEHELQYAETLFDGAGNGKGKRIVSKCWNSFIDKYHRYPLSANELRDYAKNGLGAKCEGVDKDYEKIHLSDDNCTWTSFKDNFERIQRNLKKSEKN